MIFKKLMNKINFFKKRGYQSGWDNDFGTGLTISGSSGFISTSYNGEVGEPNENIDDRIEKKPVEIFGELMMEIPEIDLNNLDHKLSVIYERARFLKEHMGVNPTDESEAIGYLLSRKKFKKKGKLFQWPVTNKKLINALCLKYKVTEVNFAGYYKTVPNEALDKLKKYITAHKKVSKLRPDITVIVDQGGVEEKKDPIMLAKSPFGKWYYVLGAWDKEVEFVDEIIYNNH